jgi:uncharacterized protein (TIGR03000 family)
MRSRFRFFWGIVGILLLAGAGARAGSDWHDSPYASDWAVPPSYFGYPLDDLHPGYYGGGRYREYYSFGRGYGFAEFPDSVPGRWWLRPGRGYTTYSFPVPVAEPVEPVARLEVHVPADADVWLEGSQTRQRGTTRWFVSPALEPGRQYAYEVRFRWLEDGRALERTDTINVRAGDRVRLRLLTKSDPEPLPQPSRVKAQEP